MMHTPIPHPIAEAVVTMLQPYAPELTVKKLEQAIFRDETTSRSEKLLTRKEAAKKLSVSIPTIDRMLRDGDLPHRHIRRAVRIPLSAVNLIIESNNE